MNKRKIWWITGAVLLVVLAAGSLLAPMRFSRMRATSSSGAAPMALSSMGFSSFAEIDEDAERTFDGVSDKRIASPFPEESGGVTAGEADQKIVRTGTLDLIVADVGETESKIAAFVDGAGGFVQDSDVSEREDGTHFGNVTVRVPSDRFDESMAAIKSYAKTVSTESSQGRDVTEQYTDIDARLRNAKAQEQEYLKILTQARTVADILNVQSYLSGVRSEIESLQGRLQYLENVTSYSTIAVGLSEETTLRLPTKDFDLLSTFKEAFQTLGALAQTLAVSLVWILIVGGGILVPAGLLVWSVVRIVGVIRRKR